MKRVTNCWPLAVFIFAAVSTLALSCAATTRLTSTENDMNNRSAGSAVQAGNWGGTGAIVVIEDANARLEFDCAHASMAEAFTSESDGTFDLPVAYVKERPGPIRAGEKEVSYAGRAAGRVSDTTMTLTVTVIDLDVTLGPFTLTAGDEGRLRKCR